MIGGSSRHGVFMVSRIGRRPVTSDAKGAMLILLVHHLAGTDDGSDAGIVG
jgi:hypothetical protein